MPTIKADPETHSPAAAASTKILPFAWYNSESIFIVHIIVHLDMGYYIYIHIDLDIDIYLLSISTSGICFMIFCLRRATHDVGIHAVVLHQSTSSVDAPRPETRDHPKRTSKGDRGRGPFGNPHRKCHGKAWNFMGFNGIQWDLMEFNGIFHGIRTTGWPQDI